MFVCAKRGPCVSNVGLRHFVGDMKQTILVAAKANVYARSRAELYSSRQEGYVKLLLQATIFIPHSKNSTGGVKVGGVIHNIDGR